MSPRIFLSLAIVAFAGTAQARQTDYLDAPISTLAARPDAAAVINKDIPDLLSNSNYDVFKALSLRQVSALSGGKLTHEMLLQTQADLNALPGGKIQKASY